MKLTMDEQIKIRIIEFHWKKIFIYCDKNVNHWKNPNEKEIIELQQNHCHRSQFLVQ